MAKIGRTLSYINTSPKPERNNGQTEQNQANGSSRPGNGGSSSFPGNLQEYLLKSIWDRVWEIKTDSQGNEYIFGKLPVVTQYGITMYADGGELNLPSIYAGLPIDNSTLIRDDNGVLKINPDIDLGGGASTWDELIGKPTWIGSTKPSYNYSEILQTPDLSVYALASDLAKYVTLAGDETITGLKNFAKGLQIDGLGITKSQDDVIYLDANLVVRGGITMFGTNSVDVPTIMDAIATDNVNLKVVDGVLTFVGSSGGGLSEVYWNDVIGRPTLLSSFIDDVGYLQKSGGQMTGNIGYTLTPDSYGVGIPAAGVIPEYTGATDFTTKKSFMGNGHNANNGRWYNIISVRADNGSSNFGMYIVSSMTDYQGNLTWNKQEGYEGAWQGERVILDSVNWSNYIQVQGGGSFISTSGGTITNSGTGLYINRTMAGAVAHITFQVNGSNVGDIGVNSAGSPAFYSYGLSGISQGWKTLMYSGGSGYSLSNITIEQANWGNGLKLNRNAVNSGAGISSYSQGSFLGTFGINGMGQFEFSNKTNTTVFIVKGDGDVLAYGGITMYSDIRKKTKLADVELSLKQIADAPLIEHYYNSDSNKTTHVGSIAQYWAETIGNDWFCKLDSEGYYTMEIQNAALASAISIARELVKYESKTDRKIRLLKQRVKELEDKIKKLENN